ncbi:MAG TPA: hypothetical protein VHG28_22505 [Longimicrobiaceae bacterium]|nr:hypothetical protein [Longimicrobiaceae bacterium]
MRSRRKSPEPAAPAGTRGRDRPSPPPPGILYGPGENLPGVVILDEIRSPTGILLWQAARDAVLWASVPPGRRGELFARGALSGRLARLPAGTAEAAPEGGLRQLTWLLLQDPGSAAPQEVAAACKEVAEWAERRGALGVALAFYQAAALVDPEDPVSALRTGLAASRRGEGARAEAWLRRTIVLAHRRRHGAAYAHANLELGNLYVSRGEPLHARRFFLYAVRHARRRGLRDIRAQALHGLFDLAHSGAIADDPDPFGREALWFHSAAHPRVPELFRAWVRLRFRKDPPVPVLTAPTGALHCRGPAPARALLFAILAREAAGAGASEQYEWAWDRAWALLVQRAGRHGDTGHVPALLELAHAAAEAGEWSRAEYMGQRALDAAISGRDEEREREVERFLTSLWSRSGRMDWLGRPHGPPPRR